MYVCRVRFFYHSTCGSATVGATDTQVTIFAFGSFSCIPNCKIISSHFYGAFQISGNNSDEWAEQLLNTVQPLINNTLWLRFLMYVFHLLDWRLINIVGGIEWNCRLNFREGRFQIKWIIRHRQYTSGMANTIQITAKSNINEGNCNKESCWKQK